LLQRKNDKDENTNSDVPRLMREEFVENSKEMGNPWELVPRYLLEESFHFPSKRLNGGRNDRPVAKSLPSVEFPDVVF